MTKMVSIIGIITSVSYFLSVSLFLITKTEAALTAWELMTVFSAPIVLFVLLELSNFLSITSTCKKAMLVFMSCTCALTGAAHIVNITVTRKLIKSNEKSKRRMKSIVLFCGILCLVGFFGTIFINENIWYAAPVGYGIGTQIFP